MSRPPFAAFFRRAVLAALAVPALPACGGSTTSTAHDAGGPDATPLPVTHCDWTAGARAPCSWSLAFNGDPVACAGFSGTGTAAQCLALCGLSAAGDPPTSCSVYGSDAGPGEVACDVTTGTCKTMFPPGNGGRRPEAFAALGFGVPGAGRERGTHFARVAMMEAGSVDAFKRLRDELRAHRAPARLVRAAERATRDEVRHVRQTAALARRFGEEALPPLPPPTRAPRSLEAMALENAVEGCVRETYSALECLWQADRAADPVVRASMARIARDELRHLELAWQVHGWAMARLAPPARDRLRAAQRRAVTELRDELRDDPHGDLVRDGGLPRAADSQRLVAAIGARLAA